MAKKIIAIEVDNANLIKTAESKAKAVKKSVAEKEVESFGIVDSSRGYYHSYEYNDLWMRERDYFCKALFEDPLFHERVSERYAEIREDVVLSVFKEMELVLNILEKAQQRNIQRWPLTKERKTWVEEYALSNAYLDIDSLEGHYTLVEETLSERLAILDKEYLR